MRSLKVTTAIAAFCMVMALAGCGTAKTPQGGQAASPAPSVSPTAAKSIVVYFGDASANNLVEKSVVIQPTSENGKYAAALEALKRPPAGDAVSLCPNTTFRSVELKNGTLTVDMSIPDSDKLGAPGEQLFMQAIEKTLFQFSEVQAIELLVEGKQADSLMGHMELPHPIKRK